MTWPTGASLGHILLAHRDIEAVEGRAGILDGQTHRAGQHHRVGDAGLGNIQRDGGVTLHLLAGRRIGAHNSTGRHAVVNDKAADDVADAQFLDAGFARLLQSSAAFTSEGMSTHRVPLAHMQRDGLALLDGAARTWGSAGRSPRRILGVILVHPVGGQLGIILGGAKLVLRHPHKVDQGNVLPVGEQRVVELAKSDRPE